MIMVAARIFDAFNDPIMGNIIERTRSKWGKFKPWQLAGSLSTSIVLFLAFNTKLTGWSFVTFFGIIYISVLQILLIRLLVLSRLQIKIS